MILWFYDIFIAIPYFLSSPLSLSIPVPAISKVDSCNPKTPFFGLWLYLPLILISLSPFLLFVSICSWVFFFHFSPSFQLSDFHCNVFKAQKSKPGFHLSLSLSVTISFEFRHFKWSSYPRIMATKNSFSIYWVFCLLLLICWKRISTSLLRPSLTLSKLPSVISPALQPCISAHFL